MRNHLLFIGTQWCVVVFAADDVNEQRGDIADDCAKRFVTAVVAKDRHAAKLHAHGPKSHDTDLPLRSGRCDHNQRPHGLERHLRRNRTVSIQLMIRLRLRFARAPAISVRITVHRTTQRRTKITFTTSTSFASTDSKMCPLVAH